ncbi:flagella protein [Natronoarchaeum philippinense]|uniref:Flagella protein n=1 Tax=Natronoarchaeum philippinense TaxID=558529 RepID=A0A285NCE1_NATPI|nr:FlaD/FlaE family flagellar protein [Natronoarchaeum philippinense]SNZ05616.1 flagella protein [Natronoarchaeum philippinense]
MEHLSQHHSAPSTGGPHLESLDGTAAEQVTAMAWARYLGSAFGSSGAIRALRYYRDVRWISEEVYNTMVDYVRGLSVDELTGDEAIDRETSVESLRDTPYERHARSLEFVAAIAGDSIERDLTTLRLGDEAMGAVGGLGGNDDSSGSVPKENQCAATTADGEACTRPALGDSEFCHEHHDDADASDE